ncbi:MAG: ADP-L-glycero-D-manno-heptose-6-epimerase [Chlamydiae bacterium]|nr:ADP-L-glycero-D-manno-heptose-6-epimerase [Chlamydiota bacterium]
MKTYEDPLIIVTGAAGFIGSGVLRHLNDKGTSNLVVVDDLGTTEKWKNLVGKSFSDIINIQQFFSWLEGKESIINAIIHLGACSSTVEKDASFLLENNYRFSVRLAEYALNHNIRFIYASSAATYGDGSRGFSDDHDTLENLVPLNMYGYSKHLFDLWLKRRGVLDKVVGLKYFNVFGPNEYHKERMASAILHILPTAQNEKVIRLFKSSDPENFSDGDQCRDFIYVKDAVRMTCAFLENTVSGIFNVGTGRAGTWNEIANSVFKALDMPVNIQYIDMPEDLIGKYQNYTRADISKTAGVLGKDAICDSLENSVVDYVKNYLVSQGRW